MDIDSFKRELFLNKTAATKREYIKNKFWSKYDSEGWAIWYVEYNKLAGECEVVFKTCNLLDGFIRVTYTQA